MGLGKVEALAPVPIDAIHDARRRIVGTVIRTPLVRLYVEGAPAEIYLKLENLQLIGSFKLRGASNLILQAGLEPSGHGVWTASAAIWRRASPGAPAPSA